MARLLLPAVAASTAAAMLAGADGWDGGTDVADVSDWSAGADADAGAAGAEDVAGADAGLVIPEAAGVMRYHRLSASASGFLAMALTSIFTVPILSAVHGASDQSSQQAVALAAGIRMSNDARQLASAYRDDLPLCMSIILHIKLIKNEGARQ